MTFAVFEEPFLRAGFRGIPSRAVSHQVGARRHTRRLRDHLCKHSQMADCLRVWCCYDGQRIRAETLLACTSVGGSFGLM
jgi:hypothetical protein